MSAGVAGAAPPEVVLRQASPESVGLDPAPIELALQQVRAHAEPRAASLPTYAGAVAVMGHAGAVVARDASGWAVRHADATTELPRERWVPMRADTVVDLASVSKLFTSIAAVQVVEEGRVGLEGAVAAYLPEFAASGKEAVTVRHLLTHTSGLTSWLPLHSSHPDRASRLQAVMDEALVTPPGSRYCYSDLNLITLGLLVERVTGQGLDVVVRERITVPLGMRDTGFNPTDRTRTAATEHQTTPPRGMVRGEVHDENAWSLGGVAGHAGVFSTADDLAVLAQALLNGGTYAGARLLDRSSVTSLVTNHNAGLPGHDHGLGFELNQPRYMGALAGPRTAGHTGFTGTSVVIDFATGSFAILLTNRVHPSRCGEGIDAARRQWAGGLALSMGRRQHPARP